MLLWSHPRVGMDRQLAIEAMFRKSDCSITPPSELHESYTTSLQRAGNAAVILPPNAV